jgi:hypothetical protein
VIVEWRMSTFKTELRELAWLASIVTGLSLLGVGLAVTIVMALERSPIGTSSL